jgi:hypothetical protein
MARRLESSEVSLKLREEQQMKHIVSAIALSMTISTLVHASHNTSRFRVRDIDNRPIRVQLDYGPIVTDNRTVVFNFVTPGEHQITVWVQGTFRNPHAFRLVHTGIIRIPASSDVRAILGRNNRVRIHDIQPLFPTYGPAPFASTVYSQTQPGHCGTYGPTGMHEGQFRNILAAMDHAGFESTKLQLARQAIESSGIVNTEQLRAMIIRLDFESSRLKLARMAYPFTVDQDNYYGLFDLFHFDSSIRELSQMIGSS